MRLKKLWRLLTSKFMLVCFLLLIEVALLPTAVILLMLYNVIAAIVCGSLIIAVNAVLTIYIINTDINADFKIAWIVLILLLPPVGAIFYLLLRARPKPRRKLKKLRSEDGTEEADPLYAGADSLPPSFDGADDFTRQCATYTAATGGLPATDYTHAEYFKTGEEYEVRLLEELQKAEKYIFLEYFIIAKGKFWGEVLDILREKKKAGLDVRVIYDDIGSMFKVPTNYAAMLEKEGIPCICFNRFRPVLDVAQNNRTHRKIAVIDGKVAFTGGVNLADEYINETHPFGHWKDTGLLVRGRTVQNFTALFLQTWALKGEEPDTARYLSDAPIGKPCLCFGDSPFDGDRNLCEDLYLRIIYNAKRYVYIYTPYLIPDGEMKRALITAVRSGVDVRILVPHIPDKRYVFAVTKAFAAQLVKHGVKIYRYTPGFLHAKSIVSDGKYSVIGSSNIDFRSFYLHFENNMMFFDEAMSGAIERDFLETCERSAPITQDQFKDNLFQACYRAILCYFAPLM